MGDLLRRTLRRAVRELGLRRAPRPPLAPATIATTGAAEPAIAGIELHACTLFHSYLRLRGVVTLAPGACQRDLAVTVTQDGRAPPPQSWNVVDSHGGGSLEFAAEALVDRAMPFAGMRVAFRAGDRHSAWRVQDLLPAAQLRDLRSLMPRFQDALRDHPGGRPRLLDIGGRARSAVQRSEMFPDCDVTVLDIVAATGVDVVADAHAMSRSLPAEHFDFVTSFSVFEHLLMPWKVAVEMNRVMRPGALALIHTHQTIGMHDMPWDFYRFSDATWAGLFNARTGFEVVATDMSRYLHIIPAVVLDPAIDHENAGGFEVSQALVRKIGPCTLDWPVATTEVIATSYPTGPAAAPPPGG